jgi:hypothetical protein
MGEASRRGWRCPNYGNDVCANGGVGSAADDNLTKAESIWGILNAHDLPAPGPGALGLAVGYWRGRWLTFDSWDLAFRQ